MEKTEKTENKALNTILRKAYRQYPFTYLKTKKNFNIYAVNIRNL